MPKYLANQIKDRQRGGAHAKAVKMAFEPEVITVAIDDIQPMKTDQSVG
jgi:hypothetical protein